MISGGAPEISQRWMRGQRERTDGNLTKAGHCMVSKQNVSAPHERTCLLAGSYLKSPITHLENVPPALKGAGSGQEGASKGSQAQVEQPHCSTGWQLLQGTRSLRGLRNTHPSSWPSSRAEAQWNNLYLQPSDSTCLQTKTQSHFSSHSLLLCISHGTSLALLSQPSSSHLTSRKLTQEKKPHDVSAGPD